MHSRRKSPARPASRGQLTAGRLTPSSPLAQSFDPKISPDVGADMNPQGLQDREGHAQYRITAENGGRDEPSTERREESGSKRTDESAMLSPPLSSPSSSIPSTHSCYDATEAPSNCQGTVACPVVLSSTLPKIVHEYISRLTSDDLEHPRLDEALQDIWQMSGTIVDPKSLKREVLLNAKQRHLDGWADDTNGPLEDDSLLAYQRRLMLDDIDNRLRLLDVPT